MAETAVTGGNVSFQYERGHRPQMNREEKYEIKQAYNEYYERKRQEKKRRNLIWIVVVLIVILGVVYYLTR